MQFRFGDLVLESDIPLAELPPCAASQPECLLEADSSGELPELELWDHHWRADDGTISLSCARRGDDYRLGIPGQASFRILEGGRRIVSLAPAALPPWSLEHQLIDQVLPRVLTHRGRTVLHAGCVDTPEGAVAFLGASGAGKSTLCAEMARAGHTLLSDDAILVRRTAGGSFEVLPTYPGLRLLPRSIAHLIDEGACGRPVAHATPKRRIDRLRAGFGTTVEPRPLLALFVLGVSETVRIQPMPPRQAFLALVAASFQLHLDDPARSRRLFEGLGALVDRVPVRKLLYPREFARLPDVRSTVAASLLMAPRLEAPASAV